MGSRDKGSSAELDIAKQLKAWWERHEPLSPDGKPISFVRTPLSGGWGKPTERAGFRASGDLMTTSATFPFVVEVKRREGWSWTPLIAGKLSPIWGWWRQTQASALEMGGEPILFWRKNREPWWVMVRETFATRRRLYTAGVDVRWNGRLANIDVGDRPRAFPAETFFAFPPSRFAPKLVGHDGMVVPRRRTPNGKKTGNRSD